MVKTGEQQNFLSNSVWIDTNLDLPKKPYIHVLGWVFTGGDPLLQTVSGTYQAWGMIFKFIENSDQLWWLQKTFTWFLGITLSAKLRVTSFHTTYFLKPSPGTRRECLPEVLLRERIWKELLSPVIQGSVESSCPDPPTTRKEGN